MTDPKVLAQLFKALSVDTRVRIIQLLRERSMCVNALAAHLRMTAPAVSQHLRILRNSGIVVDRKAGNFVHYSINPETLAQWEALAAGLLGGAHPAEGCVPERDPLTS